MKSDPTPSLSPAPAPLKELVAAWRRSAIALEGLASIQRANSSVGLAQPNEWDARRLRKCADEVEAVSALSPHPPTSELEELFKFIGVTNLKDAKQSITGLRERIKFTETFEALRDGSPHPPSEERK